MGLFLGVAYAALLPVISYLDPAQAKINTQQNAVPLLWAFVANGCDQLRSM